MGIPYVERVARNLQGLTAVSTGTCPGCATCRDASGDYTLRERWRDVAGEEVYVYYFRARDEQNFATEELAEEAARVAFDEGTRDGRLPDEGSFSWAPCDVCDSPLGGDRYVWHYCATENPAGPIEHGDGACVDCVAYLVNGDVPADTTTEEG